MAEVRDANLVIGAMFGIAVVLAGVPPLLVARFAPDVEVPVAVGALVVGMAGGACYRRILAPGTYAALHRFMLWVGLCMGCFCMAAVLCFLHGWVQVGVGLFFAAGAASRVAYRTLAEAALAGRIGGVRPGEEGGGREPDRQPSPLWMAPDRGSPHAEPDSCLVYPVRTRLLKTAAVTGCLAAVMIAAVVFIVTTTSPFAPVPSSFSATTGGLVFVITAVCLLIPLCALWFLLVLYRLLRPGLSMSVTSEGILDNCSLFATGVGLIRWDNLAAVNPIGRSRFARDSAVRLAVRDPSALLTGRPWRVRLLRRVFVAVTRVEADLYIPLFMIDAYRAGDLVAVIRRQYEGRRARDRHLAALPPARIIA